MILSLDKGFPRSGIWGGERVLEWYENEYEKWMKIEINIFGYFDFDIYFYG